MSKENLDRKGSQSSVKELYHYKRSVKLTLERVVFSQLEYKGMQSLGKSKKTTTKENQR